MSLETFFAPEDLKHIEDAVREAESRTSGEIVPCAVERSDAYAGAVWRATALGALVAVLAAALLHASADLWGVPLAAWILAPSLIGAVLAHLAVEAIPALKRLVVPRAARDERVHERAVQAFVEEEVFATRDRTGILIFLSLFERRVVVLADKGIAAKVEQGEWDAIVSGVVEGMRRGAPGQALARAILRCGEVLERHHVERRPDDRDELANGLRIEPV